MFSKQHDRHWQEIKHESPARLGARSHVAALDCAHHDSTIAQLLFSSEFGAGGDLDRQLLRDSVRVKAAAFQETVYAVAPIYVTSICQERCLYCNYRADNKKLNVERLRLTDEQLTAEVEFLIQEKGLRVLELVYATDPNVRVDTMCHHVELVQTLLDRRGGGTVGINAEALDVEEYRRLLNAGLEFAVVWQETYDPERYHELHPGKTKKSCMEYRLDAFDRMIAAGLRHFGMGVLSGLADWRKDWAMLIQHEAYLLREYGIGASILGIPRLKPAAGALVKETPFIPTANEYRLAVALHNIFSPETLAFVNTREDWEMCVDLATGGGCMFTFNCSTIPGGYALGHKGYQFPTGSFDTPAFAPRLREHGLEINWKWSFADLDLLAKEACRSQVSVAAV
jgi:2-iminoacetate synthase